MKSKIQELMKFGHTNQQIAKELNLSLWKIKKLKLDYGLSNTPHKKIDTSLLRKYYEEGLLDPEIAKKLNCNVAALTRVRQKLGLPGRYKVYDEFPLKGVSLEAFLGSMLGDGHLSIGKGRYPSGSFAHSDKQKDYFFNKYELWKEVLSEWSFKEHFDKRTSKTYYSYFASVNTHPGFMPYYEMLYKNKVKKVTKEYLELLTPVSIAYWFMDDGGKRTLATNSFDDESLDNIENWFHTKFDISVVIYKDNSLYFDKENFKKLSDLIRPYVIDSMLYKLT